MTTTTQGAPALVFHDTTFSVVDHNGHPWLRSGEIAKALGYADGSAINRIYARHSTEFTPCMAGSVKLTDPQGDPQETRIFSLRGAHLLAMFSRTPVAAEFRRWVLDLLDREVAQPPKALPAPKSKLSKALREHINRSAHQVAMAQFDNATRILTACALDNLACGASQADAAQYVEALASHCGELALVNVRDVQELVRAVASAIDAAGAACATIHRIEQRTGLQLHHQPADYTAIDPDFHKHDRLVHEVVRRIAGEPEERS